MKKLFILTLAAVLSLANILVIHAQDVVTVKPDNTDGVLCAFNFTFTNHNIAGKNIDGVQFELLDTNVIFNQLRIPSKWTNGQDNNPDVSLSATADNGGILPNTTLGGFLLDYTYDPNEAPVSVKWVASNGGVGLDSGIVKLICTQFQSYSKLEIVATVRTTQSGPDPCFFFTMSDQNQPNFAPIKYVAFQLENLNGGSLRPSKITPAQGWTLDSVTKYTAYFHSDNNEIHPGESTHEFGICLRGSSIVTQYSFVWFAWDESHGFIDRDTLFNISNTTTSSPSDADVVVIPSPNGCFYSDTLKNFHVSNTLPPSRIVRYAITSKTAGVTFASAPNAPPFWRKQISTDGSSVTFTAPADSLGIPGGTAATFNFSMSGPTTSNFILHWEADQGADSLETKFTMIDSGNLTLRCTPAVPATDSASLRNGTSECGYVLTVKNAHNTAPHLESDLTQITISIPAGSGLLSATGSSDLWDFNTIPSTTIKYQFINGSLPMGTGNSQELTFLFTPNIPGQNITATWTTIDANNKPITTGTFTVTCSPIVVVCDTFVYNGTKFLDSCAGNSFTLRNRKLPVITRLDVSPTNGWLIDSSSTPVGWTQNLTFSKASITYTSAEGLKQGDSALFSIKFIAHHPVANPDDSFAVVAISTDKNGATCTSTDSVLVCHSLPTNVGDYVQPTSDNTGVSNFSIRPNPTQGMVDISFDMNTQEHVLITVLDVLGHQIKPLSSRIMAPGSYHIPYVMNNLPDGTYYIRMQTTLGVVTKKLVLTK